VRYDLLVFLLPAQSPACLVHPKECELIVGSRTQTVGLKKGGKTILSLLLALKFSP
jgi:hypothetical protein